MPDSNNPLETALRNIKNHLHDAGLVSFPESVRARDFRVLMTRIRAELITFRNLSLKPEDDGK